MKERFWERDSIYGGISWTNQPIEQIWYPTHGIHSEKGIMLGAYTFNAENGRFFERLSPENRIRAAIEQGEKIHPGYGDYVECGVSVPWARMNHMIGCNAQWTEELLRTSFDRLLNPEGRHYMMGDQISHHSGWQEGALSSAHHALADINERVQAEISGPMAMG